MNNQKITFEEAVEEIKEEFNLFLNGCGLISEEQIKTEMERNDDFRKVYEANMLAIEALQDYRPKGYWNYIQAGMAVCPFCGANPHKDYKNFCPKCGADMRGGKEK